MNTPKNILSQIGIGIIAGGDKTDPCSMHNCAQKVWLPLEHSPDGVKLDHLAFSSLSHSPTKHSQETFHGVMDPGSMVFVLKETGSNQCIILGQANDVLNYDQGIPGNANLLSNPIVNELMTRTFGIRIPPSYQETQERGATIRKKNEKGQYYSHSLLKGLPSNGAIFPLAGMVLPEVKNIPTAIEHFENLLTNDLFSQIMNLASNMSLGNMFSQLLQNTDLWNRATSNLPIPLRNGIVSMANLIQSIEGENEGLFVLAGRVDPEVYLSNAADLLSQVTCLNDIVEVTNRLQWDETLSGLDDKEGKIIKIETTWGKANLSVSANGAWSIDRSNNQQDIITAFQDAMASSSSSPGMYSGDNMFGGSAKTIMDMLRRMGPNSEKGGTNLHKQLNTSDVAKKLQKILEKVIKGGNPLDPSLFE